MDRHFRVKFVNALSGPRTAFLLGSINNRGQTNLAVFNSIVHVGANPPLIGFVMRPLTVERHSYENIRQTGVYSLSIVNTSFIEQAHKTAGKFEREVSEFEACGFTEAYDDNFPAPYVGESSISLLMSIQEEHEISSNMTRFMVGKIESIVMDNNLLEEDGHINHQINDSALVAALETYYAPKLSKRFTYKS